MVTIDKGPPGVHGAPLPNGEGPEWEGPIKERQVWDCMLYRRGRMGGYAPSGVRILDGGGYYADFGMDETLADGPERLATILERGGPAAEQARQGMKRLEG